VNERIQQFAEQARISVPAGLDTVEWIEKYNEIFAELIVRECASLFPHTFTDEQYQRRIDKTIKKHFGVEE
jgi:hypothetical protein